MSTTEAENDWTLPPSTRLARGFLTLMPMLLLAFPLLVLPLLFPEKAPELSDELQVQAAASNNAPIVQLIYPVLFIISFLAFTVSRPAFTRRAWVLTGLLGVFLAYAAMSSLWSLEPTFSLNKAIYQMIICALLFMSVAGARTPAKIFDALFWLMAALVVVNLFYVLTRPPGPIGHEGIYDHKNTLGANASTALLFGIYGVMRPVRAMRIVGIITAIGAMICLVASESKTSLGVAVLAPFGAAALYFLARRARVSPLFAILVGLVIVGALYVIAGQIFSFDHEDLFLLLFNDVTFTGRTEIWAFTWQHLIQHPVFGWGFQGFWGIGEKSPKLLSEIYFIKKMAYAHNGFLDMWLETGLVGLTIFMTLFFTVLALCGRLLREGRAVGMLTLMLLLFCIGRNMMESNWMAGTATASVMFLLLGMMAAFLPNDRSTEGNSEPTQKAALRRTVTKLQAPATRPKTIYAYQQRSTH